MSPRRRLDQELVRRGLAPSRAVAAELIEAGSVTVSGSVADKAARLVAAGEPVEVIGPTPRYVGRGGLKLEAALDRFGLDVGGMVVLDAGSSTGGFTDCLLQRGAAKVIAVDVGRHQLHERLRADPRVDVRERTDIRSLDPATLPEVDLVVADLAFISLSSVADALLAPLGEGGALVVLLKPQFEAGRAEASRGRGVISDPVVWRKALDRGIAALLGAGADIMDGMVSPVRGADGNVEFFLSGRRRWGPAVSTVDVDLLVSHARELR
jgi:23S rRNA (cytidine1920-2'-O)/16S rRNA (cytidine1409-2'-O)-methyltransferase